MDTFPEDFTLANLMSIIEKKQQEMTLTVRQNFYEKIKESADSCQTEVKLEFPPNHWPVHKKVIAEELLNIFGEITTVTHNKRTNSTAYVPISEAQNIPSNIHNIIIKFMNEDV